MELGFCESKLINIDTMLRGIMCKVFNEIRKPQVLEKIERINSKFSKMPYYKNYSAVSGAVHNISHHEDAVRDILISEGIMECKTVQKKETIHLWIEHPELSTRVPVNSFIYQPCGPNDSPDFIIKLSETFILAIECKSSNNLVPLYNSGGVKQNYLYVFSSNSTNETVTYMGSDIITIKQQELIDAHIKEARERDEILNTKLREIDTNSRGISYYTRPMIGQSGGKKFTNYFTHENREASGKSVLNFVENN
jgi:hypothetical protein